MVRTSTEVLEFFTGRYLWNSSPTGLPTTGSRTMYLAADNAACSYCCSNFIYSAMLTNGSDQGGSGFFTMQAGRTCPAKPSSASILKTTTPTTGVYAPGYGQIAGILNTTVFGETLPRYLPGDVHPKWCGVLQCADDAACGDQ